MNIGIFPGSFNPIHVGHLILANYIVEFTEIDEIWFLVSPQNPHKKRNDLLDENIRYEMAKIALENYSRIKVSDFEFSLPRPSYTMNTLEKLSERYSEHDFTLLIGADNWAVFEKWKDYSCLLEKYPIKVYPRLGYRIIIPSKLKNRVEALESPIVEISSTFIRESIADGKYIKAFLPEKVFKYIEENKLYR